MKTLAPICVHCHTLAVITPGMEIYPHRKDLFHKWFYACNKCLDAYVGCHKGTQTALGRPANAALRKTRREVHKAIDALWQVGNMSRSQMYRELATTLSLPKSACHVAMFNLDQCAEAIKFANMEHP